MTAPIRVVIQQPALPRYRVPVFAALAQRPGIALKVVYGTVPGVPNAEAHGFDATFVPERSLRLAGRRLSWHAPQWSCATRRQCDVLILSWNLNCLSLVPALLRARRRGVPTILWGHGYSKAEARWRRLPRERVVRLARAVLFYDRRHACRLVERGIAAERVFVAPNSLDQTPIERAREAWRKDHDALASFRRREDLEERPLALFVSRLEEANRVDLLIDAIALLGDELPRLQAVVVGSGADEARLRARAATRGVADRVRFLGAIYDEAELAPWFLSAGVFCYPANIGLSLLHAFGYGVPVVTSDRTEAQNPEVTALRHGENGLLFADGDAKALADAMRAILTDPALHQRMAAEALTTVREDFTLSNMVEGMERAIRFCAYHSG